MWLRKRMTKRARSTYPIVIRQARYSGVYEGGAWIATASTPAIPEPEFFDYLTGDDEDALDLFLSRGACLIGRGDTPNDALVDLERRLKEVGLL